MALTTAPGAAMARAARNVLLAVLLLAAWPRCVCALVEPYDSFQIGSHGFMEYSPQFGFLQGGTYFINLTLVSVFV